MIVRSDGPPNLLLNLPSWGETWRLWPSQGEARRSPKDQHTELSTKAKPPWFGGTDRHRKWMGVQQHQKGNKKGTWKEIHPKR